MKNHALNIFAMLAVAALLATPLAFAQSAYLTAVIPFDFVVGDRTLPAGSYQVVCSPNGSPTVTLRGVDVKAVHIALTQATRSAKLPKEGKLIFNRYGNSNFLAQVWRPGVSQGNLLPTSKTEREMAARAARGGTTEVAVSR
jgi:hypothetical protein